jgi:hypothetical protein
MSLKLRVLPLLAILVSGVCVTFLGYRGYHWWEKQQKRKALFLYFQKNSPVTKRIPADAFFYANLYDVRRVQDELKGTNFSKVLGYWLDTGMAENEKANPLLGGMLEKTIFNVIGEEFAVALLPGKGDAFDFLAVARIAPGADFLLNLGLSQARNIEKIDTDQKLFYKIRTKSPYFPFVIVSIQDNFAYASNSFERLKQAYSSEGSGPKFLAESPTEGISENTILFAQLANPNVRALFSGKAKHYAFTVSETPAVVGTPPDAQRPDNEVLRIQTNASGAVGQPSATYLLQSVSGKPVSALLLGFANLNGPTMFQHKLLSHRNSADPPESFQVDGVDCMRDPVKPNEEFICTSGASLLLAQGQFLLGQAKFQKSADAGKKPLVLNVEFQKNSIQDYRKRMEQQDWSRFKEASAFYFLSCIQEISGRIDGSHHEIKIDID